MACPQQETPEYLVQRAAHRAVLAVSLLFVLAAVCVSVGLVVYTAWLHDLEDGPFALLFAILSTRAALSWCLWLDSNQHSSSSDNQQDTSSRKPVDETAR